MYCASVIDTLVALCLLAQPIDSITIETKITKLSSDSFLEREKASSWLREHPEAMPWLRKALSLKDREAVKRVADVIDHIERTPLRKLQTATNNGQVDLAIAILSEWPNGTYEDEAWSIICEFAARLNRLHTKASGEEIRWLPTAYKRPFLSISDEFNGPPDNDGTPVYVRSKQIKWKERGPIAGTLVASGKVSVCSLTVSGVIFASGPVEIELFCKNLIVCSCADVVLNADAQNCLVIARGRITCLGSLSESRIISAKTVTYKKVRTQNCAIAENNQIPLGFIRWADAPKDKAAPKSK